MNQETGSEIFMYIAQDYVLSSHRAGQALTYRRAKQNKERKREWNTLHNSLALLRASLKVRSLGKMTLCCSVRGSYFTSDKPLLALADCPGQIRIGLGGEFTSLAHIHCLQDLPWLWHWQSLQPSHSQSREMNFAWAGLARKRKIGIVAKKALGSA